MLAVAWIARRRPSWDADAATRVLHRRRDRLRGPVARSPGPASSTPAGRAGRTASVRSRGALDAAGAATSDRVMSIDAAGTKYWTGRGGVVLVNDPIETIEAVARAYDIRWLVLERRRHRGGRRADPGGDERPAWIGPRSSRSLAWSTRQRRPPTGGSVSASTRSVSNPRTRAAPRQPRWRPDDPPRSAPEPWASCSSWRSSTVRSSRRRSSSRSRRTRPTTSASRATSSRAAASCRDALWSYQTPPLDLPAPRVRGLAAAADASSPPSRWPSSGRPSPPPRSPGPDRARSSRSSPGGWRRTSPRSAGCRRPRPDAGDRHGPDRGGLPAAPPPLGPARLDDAVRGAGARRLPADDPDRARAARRTPDRSAADRAWRAVGLAALTRNEAAWLGLTWALVAWLAPCRARARSGSG